MQKQKQKTVKHLGAKHFNKGWKSGEKWKTQLRNPQQGNLAEKKEFKKAQSTKLWIWPKSLTTKHKTHSAKRKKNSQMRIRRISTRSSSMSHRHWENRVGIQQILLCEEEKHLARQNSETWKTSINTPHPKEFKVSTGSWLLAKNKNNKNNSKYKNLPLLCKTRTIKKSVNNKQKHQQMTQPLNLIREK